MTIQQLLNNEKVNFLHVNVLKKISSTQFIVGDKTGLAIMIIASEDATNVEIGKGLKMVKPSLVEKEFIACHPKFSPMKTKHFQIDVNPEDVMQLEMSGKKNVKVDKGISFNQIENDYSDNAIIDSVLVYVTTKSKTIDGKYGSYQICNMKDYEGNALSINLYKQNMNRLEVNKVYKLQKIKKTTIKTETGLRMATTNFTKIKDASTEESDIFADVQIADHVIEGLCIMFNNLSYYSSCKKHLTKLSEDSCCQECGQIGKEDGKTDFRCSLIIENCEDGSMSSIVIFKRHLDINQNSDDTDDETEAKLIEIIEDKVVGKNCQVHYNEVGDDNNVAIKVTVS